MIKEIFLEINDTAIKDRRNIQTKKKDEVIKDQIIRDNGNIFELENEEQDYHKPVIVAGFYSGNYME